MAAEEQESGRGFRVQDRRRFSPTTGEPRPEESAEHPSEATPPEEPEASRPSHAGAARSASAPPPAEISFSSFILGLTTQTLMYMGEIPPAPGQPPQTDLAAAQQMIDVLAMLQQKTKGNRDAAEEAMLENALFDLRMRYVQLARKNRPATQGTGKE
ncbi:MAG: DUF1844 domain-containing protein [Deltaproteobacteria bacterium]|nr:DUF1844 domain-containing protein [Deltaproteobacteria bacterium]